MNQEQLIDKYNIPAPRYTSYPTVPYWNTDEFSEEKYLERMLSTFNDYKKAGISLYVHLPFCESLCTFCACNKRITKRHEVEDIYIDYILKEWHMYIQYFGEPPILKELHLGGGTPTFFSPENLTLFIEKLLKHTIPAESYTFSFEGHPNNTTEAHLQALYDLGFRRVSFGVQDYDETVQKAIHRIQPFDNVKKVTEAARKIGYTSISHDLIFGLPFQKESSIRKTIELTNLLNPDRIAFYSYAHVPWIKGVGQRGFDENDLPNGTEKRKLYELGKSLLSTNGYEEIALDHFARTDDELYKAMKNKTIHRNFMGYTEQHTHLMIGLGVSAISDCWSGFAQNEKKLEDYYNKIADNKLPIHVGHLLSDEDIKMRQYILQIMCRLETIVNPNDFENYSVLSEQLQEMQKDGLIKWQNNNLTVTEIGKPFLRNICLVFDMHYWRNRPEGNLFSMSV